MAQQNILYMTIPDLKAARKIVEKKMDELDDNSLARQKLQNMANKYTKAERKINKYFEKNKDKPGFTNGGRNTIKLIDALNGKEKSSFKTPVGKGYNVLDGINDLQGTLTGVGVSIMGIASVNQIVKAVSGKNLASVIGSLFKNNPGFMAAMTAGAALVLIAKGVPAIRRKAGQMQSKIAEIRKTQNEVASEMHGDTFDRTTLQKSKDEFAKKDKDALAQQLINSPEMLSEFMDVVRNRANHPEYSNSEVANIVESLRSANDLLGKQKAERAEFLNGDHKEIDAEIKEHFKTETLETPTAETETPAPEAEEALDSTPPDAGLSGEDLTRIMEAETALGLTPGSTLTRTTETHKTETERAEAESHETPRADSSPETETHKPPKAETGTPASGTRTPKTEPVTPASGSGAKKTEAETPAPGTPASSGDEKDYKEPEATTTLENVYKDDPYEQGRAIGVISNVQKDTQEHFKEKINEENFNPTTNKSKKEIDEHFLSEIKKAGFEDLSQTKEYVDALKEIKDELINHFEKNAENVEERTSTATAGAHAPTAGDSSSKTTETPRTETGTPAPETKDKEAEAEAPETPTAKTPEAETETPTAPTAETKETPKAETGTPAPETKDKEAEAEAPETPTAETKETPKTETGTPAPETKGKETKAEVPEAPTAETPEAPSAELSDNDLTEVITAEATLKAQEAQKQVPPATREELQNGARDILHAEEAELTATDDLIEAINSAKEATIAQFKKQIDNGYNPDSTKGESWRRNAGANHPKDIEEHFYNALKNAGFSEADETVEFGQTLAEIKQELSSYYKEKYPEQAEQTSSEKPKEKESLFARGKAFVQRTKDTISSKIEQLGEDIDAWKESREERREQGEDTGLIKDIAKHKIDTHVRECGDAILAELAEKEKNGVFVHPDDFRMYMDQIMQQCGEDCKKGDMYGTYQTLINRKVSSISNNQILIHEKEVDEFMESGKTTPYVDTLMVRSSISTLSRENIPEIEQQISKIADPKTREYLSECLAFEKSKLERENSKTTNDSKQDKTATSEEPDAKKATENAEKLGAGINEVKNALGDNLTATPKARELHDKLAQKQAEQNTQPDSETQAQPKSPEVTKFLATYVPEIYIKGGKSGSEHAFKTSEADFKKGKKNLSPEIIKAQLDEPSENGMHTVNVGKQNFELSAQDAKDLGDFFGALQEFEESKLNEASQEAQKSSREAEIERIAGSIAGKISEEDLKQLPEELQEAIKKAQAQNTADAENLGMGSE